MHRSLVNDSSGGTARKLWRIARLTSPIAAQLADLHRGPRQHARVGVAEPVDRLLAVADDEDRGRERLVLLHAEAFAPRLHQVPDQLPLRVAGVLELVDQQVVVARLEQVARARELAALRQQRQRAFERLGKVDDGVLVEHLAILVARDAKQLPHAARQHGVQVAPEGPQVVAERFGQRCRGRAMRS